jgi:hypothetical protein
LDVIPSRQNPQQTVTKDRLQDKGMSVQDSRADALTRLESRTIDEPGAEAGPGATSTNAMPSNVTSTEGVDSNEDVVAQEKTGSSAEDKVVDGREEYGGRSKAKVAIIMSALCMAVFLSALDVTIISMLDISTTRFAHCSANVSKSYSFANDSRSVSLPQEPS